MVRERSLGFVVRAALHSTWGGLGRKGGSQRLEKAGEKKKVPSRSGRSDREPLRRVHKKRHEKQDTDRKKGRDRDSYRQPTAPFSRSGKEEGPPLGRPR